VAFDSDPNTGAQVYYTPPPIAPGQPSPNGSWTQIGGTSLSAPAWAGIIAIVDQGRALAGRSKLSGPTQTLPSLYGLASSGQTSSAFHPVAGSLTGIAWSGWGWGGGWGSGSNTAGGAAAGATANIQTGLGSPNGPSLINDLAGSTTTAPLPSPFPTPSSTVSLTPTPSPMPSPTPTPTSTTPGGKHHHHHKPLQGSTHHKTHAPTSPARRVAKQGHPTMKNHLTA